MPVTLEEEVVLLYALRQCGGKPSKVRATDFILSNNLFKFRDDDNKVVETGESKVENDIAWARQNLKDKSELQMPKRGVWAITPKGVNRIERVATKSLEWGDSLKRNADVVDNLRWDRFSPEFLQRLKELGEELKKRPGK
jgi:hypothetical protein